MKRSSSESSIESRLVVELQRRRLPNLKLGQIDWPDRLIVVPNEIILMELKKRTGYLSPGQKLLHIQLNRLGIQVHVPYSYEEAIYQLDAATALAGAGKR